MRKASRLCAQHLPWVCLLLGLLLAGCSPLYVFQAAYEEGKILWRRQSIEELLKDPELDSDKREKLQLVLEARAFARGRLRLHVGGSYEGLSYVDRPVVSYVLTAVPRTSLRPHTWWFPFIGRVPYKGYFSKDRATQAAGGFKDRGYDTLVRPVSAFSTLGWFDDPLMAHLLKLDKTTLVEVIFHELVHNTLFVDGAVDFNECLATFAGNRAAIVFLEARFGQESPERRQAVQSWLQDLEFSANLNRAAAALKDLYGSDLSVQEKLKVREKIFSRSRREWGKVTAGQPGHRYRGYADEEVNNAVIVHYRLYLGGLHTLETVYQAMGADLRRFLVAVTGAVEQSRDPWEGVRKLLPSQTNDPAQAQSGGNPLA